MPTDPGCEIAGLQEIATLTNLEATREGNILILECDENNAAILAYQAQVPLRVMVEIASVKELDELQEVKPKGFEELIPEGSSFKAVAHGCKEYLSQEIMEGVGGWFYNKTGRKVDLTQPDFLIVGCETEKGVRIGVDLVGKELIKRDWRIMLSRRSLRATVAAAVGIYADIDSKDKVLDPISQDGTLVIELAMRLTGASPRRFEKNLAFERMPAFSRNWTAWRKQRESAGTADITAFSESHGDMKAVKQNAKLAGIEKTIHISRVPVDWMDLKIQENSIDAIITYPPTSGKVTSPQQVQRKLDDLFNQSKHVLSPDGTCTIISAKPEEVEPVAANYGFKVLERHPVMMGKQELHILIMRCEDGV